MRPDGEPRACLECGTWIQPRPDGSSGMVAHFSIVHPNLDPSEAHRLT